MIECRMPDHCPNVRVFDIDFPGLAPKVAIVNAQLLADHIAASRDALPRLAHNLETLFAKKPQWLGLPIVYIELGKLKFSQGRHRTVSYSMNGYTHFPVITNSQDIEQILAAYGLDFAGAEQLYDFSKLPGLPVLGR